MTPPTPAVQASGLRRSYGTPARPFEAVRGLDLSVQRGELFALLGTNGAGKTSTMELIEGLARPTGGTVRVLGHDPHRERAVLRPRIGIMLQEGGFPGDLTVAETVRGWAGTSSRPRPAAEVIELVGLTDRAAVRVKQLSGGEKRRLDLAVALVGRPEVLFLDEPTTGLDPQARAAVWQLVRELRAAGTTVLLTTHYLEEAEELADRLAILHHGRVVTQGTVAEVIADRPARIGFELPEQPAPPLLALPQAEVGFQGRQVTIRTRDLQGTLTELLLWAEHQGVRLTGLDARSASLEEAFLAIAAEAQPDRAAGEHPTEPATTLTGAGR
ncbi:ABC transporter ATP-binding protein [Kitasatospora viridis]|uniref:ABC-2 type transport system ATP-binding protein n=1 Tax=Kitasatospora viridis TaxID=281105 RepID=A0A561UHP2_9ACTN|nr:ABC transporter ATP-binding protein [Kitasatospora viridis]TWF98877.1 ABC-2 type transport system ATP-binding protein [Kitasatospora viridis]